MKAKLISTLLEYQDKLKKGKMVLVIRKHYVNTFVQLVVYNKTTNRHRQQNIWKFCQHIQGLCEVVYQICLRDKSFTNVIPFVQNLIVQSIYKLKISGSQEDHCLGWTV